MPAEHDLPPALHAVAGWMQGREPAIRFKVGALRAIYPYETPDQLADRLVGEFRGRVVKTGAVTSAIGVIPGLSTLVELGALGAQGAYAIKQEIEMVMAIAIAYGHDLTESEDRLVEVLAVAGVVTGSNLVRDRVLVEGGRRVAGERLAKASAGFAGRVGGHAVGRVPAGWRARSAAWFRSESGLASAPVLTGSASPRSARRLSVITDPVPALIQSSPSPAT